MQASCGARGWSAGPHRLVEAPLQRRKTVKTPEDLIAEKHRRDAEDTAGFRFGGQVSQVLLRLGAVCSGEPFRRSVDLTDTIGEDRLRGHVALVTPCSSEEGPVQVWEALIAESSDCEKKSSPRLHWVGPGDSYDHAVVFGRASGVNRDILTLDRRVWQPLRIVAQAREVDRLPANGNTDSIGDNRQDLRGDVSERRCVVEVDVNRFHAGPSSGSLAVGVSGVSKSPSSLSGRSYVSARQTPGSRSRPAERACLPPLPSQRLQGR